MAVQTRPQVGPASTSAGRDWLRLPRWLSWHPWVITAVLAAVLLALPATGGDLAAQEYHAWLFQAHGALPWTNAHSSERSSPPDRTRRGRRPYKARGP